MTRLEKCEYLKNKGYTYDPETGKIYGVYGKEIKNKDKDGYSWLGVNLFGHHFAWYMTYGNVDFIELDHKDTNPSNNKIDNLRIITRSQQRQNTNAKGFYLDKRSQKYQSYITINGNYNYLGIFKTEQEARNAYLEAKKKYHIID